MTSYTAITNAAIDQDSPVDEDLVQALRDNPIAMAEGASNAPKFAIKSVPNALIVATNHDFGSLGDFSGVWFSLSAQNASGAAARTITMDATDGSYLGAVTLVSIPSSEWVWLNCFFDFATGSVDGHYLTASGAGLINQTIAGASLSITGIRITTASDVSGALMLHPNGGESAS